LPWYARSPKDIVPFEIHGRRGQHELGAIEMWDSSITGFAIDDIFEDEDMDEADGAP